MKTTQLPEALRDLADSPALEATLSWDGTSYEVGPSEKYAPLSPGHRAILTRDALDLWCDGDMSDLAHAVAWVRAEQSTWFSQAEEVSSQCACVWGIITGR